MKIQIFTRNFISSIPGFEINTNKPIGGAEVYLYDLSQLLIRIGYEVEVIQAGFKNSQLEVDGIKVKIIRLNRIQRIFFPVFLSILFSKLEERDSLKIYNYPNYAIFRTKRDCKSIGIFHGVEWDTGFFEYVYREYKYRQKGFEGLLKAVIKYVYFALIVPYFVQGGIKKLNKVVSVDSNILHYLPKKLSEKIIVIPNYVDCDIFCPNPQKNDGKLDKINRILVPRNLNIARGVFLIPEVCMHLLKFRKDFVFNIVGSGPLKEYLEKEIEKNNLQQFIRLIGHIPHDKIPELYRETHIVLIPSIFSEGTTLAALEAMASGKPLIATDVGGLCDIGENMISKFVVKPDAKEIAEKILFILENKEVSSKIANTARVYVCNNFRKELWEERWKRVILEVLQKTK